ncbi:MAG: hypothetical protein KDK99_16910 [Verrucomicrobiales bacterium]|nr:hypothetical protein [Verrucomicrobiales bacterium]
MSGLAKVGIGCFILVAVLAVGLALVAPKLITKIKELSEDPTKLVVWGLEKDDRVEVLEQNSENQQVRFRIKKTGEELTVDLKGTRDGKPLFTNSKGEEVRLETNDSGEYVLVPVANENAAAEAPAAPAAPPAAAGSGQ